MADKANNQVKKSMVYCVFYNHIVDGRTRAAHQPIKMTDKAHLNCYEDVLKMQHTLVEHGKVEPVITGWQELGYEDNKPVK